MLALLVGRAKHHERRPPPTIERALRHRLLFRRSARKRRHDLVALPLMKALLLANADHGACVRAEAAAAERDLVHDRGTVNQPSDRADIGPGECWVVEDRGIFRLAGEKLLDELLARHVERLGGGVKVEAVASLVLYLGKKGGLSPQRRRPRQPIAFG